MHTIGFIASLELGSVAVAASYRRRELILALDPPGPSPALNAVLLMDLASVLLLCLVALSDPGELILLILPLVIFGSYAALSFLVLWVRPEWRKSSIFLLGAFAPLFGGVLVLLMLLAERREPR